MFIFSQSMPAQTKITKITTLYSLSSEGNYIIKMLLIPDGTTIILYEGTINNEGYQRVTVVKAEKRDSGLYIKASEKEKDNLSKMEIFSVTGPGVEVDPIVKNPSTTPTWLPIPDYDFYKYLYEIPQSKKDELLLNTNLQNEIKIELWANNFSANAFESIRTNREALKQLGLGGK